MSLDERREQQLITLIGRVEELERRVAIGASPDLDGTNFTGIPDGALDTDYVEVDGDTMSGALNMGNNLINSLSDPVSPTDAVNLQTLNSSIPAGLQWYLSNDASADVGGYKLLAETNDANQSPVTVDGTSDGQALDEWVTVAGSPGDITITEGQLATHFYAKVARANSTDFQYAVKTQFYKRASGGSETQLGSDVTSVPVLSTSTVLYFVHTHLTEPETLAVGDRIVVKLTTVRTGSAPRTNAQIVTLYLGDVTPSHTDIPVTLAILGRYVIVDGWTSVSGWSYASATTITVPSGAASIYSIGDKVKLTQTTVKYFYIVAIADTVLTVAGGSDYTLVNAAITLPNYSKATSPLGHPVWFNWITISTGFTTAETFDLSKFIVIGNVCSVVTATLFGTSNATTFTWTLPLQSYFPVACIWNGMVADNNAVQTVVGRAQLSTNSNVVTMHKVLADSASSWTAANAKYVYGPCFSYTYDPTPFS